MIDWKSKLTSRKFWAAVTEFVAMLIIALGGGQEQATQITALIMAGAGVIAYIIGEGLADAAGAKADVSQIMFPYTYDLSDKPETEEKTKE